MIKWLLLFMKSLFSVACNTSVNARSINAVTLDRHATFCVNLKWIKFSHSTNLIPLLCSDSILLHIIFVALNRAHKHELMWPRLCILIFKFSFAAYVTVAVAIAFLLMSKPQVHEITHKSTVSIFQPHFSSSQMVWLQSQKRVCGITWLNVK